MSDFTQLEILQYRSILDSLKGCEASVAALIDMADGNPFAVFESLWIVGALKSRGLIEMHFSSYDSEVGMYRDPADKYTGPVLTELGKGFLTWMRQPKELPMQLGLFE